MSTGKTGQPEVDAAHHVAGLASHSGHGDQIGQLGRDLAAEPFFERRRHPDEAAGRAAIGPIAASFVAVVDDGADVDDALALLAGDLRPVVGVRRVGQVFVLLVLLLDGLEQVDKADAPRLATEDAVDRELLRAGRCSRSSLPKRSP